MFSFPWTLNNHKHIAFSLDLLSKTSMLHAFLFTWCSCQISRNWQVTSPAITFHHTIPPGSKQADISFPGFPFDLALLHAHQSSPCSKWRIPHTHRIIFTQLTNSPQWKHLFTEDPVVNWVILPESFCSCFHNHVKVFHTVKWGEFWFCVGEGLCYVWPVEGQITDPLTDFIWFYKLHGKCFN